ncbi:MAG: TRAP transporter permease, partial [Oribacterium sp.]|nr:TRAP transporter permease [Oribacterium sp.]MDD6789604.1 TRAP transporter permease [Lachnospira sp.]
YAGAAIAKANPMKTALRASQLAIAAFMVPYVICYNPALILVNTTPSGVAVVTGTTLIGLFALAAAFEGHLFTRVPVILRIVIAIGGLLLVAPETVTDIIGLILVFGCVFIQYRRGKSARTAAA